MKISLEYADYGVKVEKLTDEQKANLISPHEIVMSYIKGSVSQKFPKGVANDKLRMLNNIQKKFDTAQHANSADIDLNSYEKALIRECYADANFDVNNMQGAVTTYEAIFPDLIEKEKTVKSETATIGK